MAAYVEAGIDEFILPDWTLPADRLTEGLDRFAAEVAAPFH
jgi:hypothetical protein